MPSLKPMLFDRKLLPKVWGGRALESVMGMRLPAGEAIGETWELFDRPEGSSTVRGATTTLASRADGANGAAGDGRSTDPLISGDGALVAFRSTSTNFDHSNDPLPDEDIYRRSLGASVTQLISITAAGTKADDDSRPVGIDRTGNDVAFITGADNLDPADAAAHDPDVYVRRGFEMVLASRDGGPAGPPTRLLGAW